ncbi:Fic family protein [Flaviaesturariibacter flavus]|uniref:Fic family protein n=1 Tax=Flaviaesturariibacter flavus TaxID=2502780 RepID=A0A4R1BIJ7_9BACT|nr:Fic family protein [Flaviaesturariibacter flavus]TCJ17074.1 Fic family protein [Flaviaesturariibacter flavus]
MYIHQHSNWPKLTWNKQALAEKLAGVRYRQGRLIGHMEALGLSLRKEAMLQALTQEVIKSSEIEGELLDRDQVRSSIARRLGIQVAGTVSADRNVEGVVDMMLDATQNSSAPLTDERLFGWQAALFPTGRSGMHRITVGEWRTGAKGPMQVVSGAIGKEKVHYEAPEASKAAQEMKLFLDWFNGASDIDPVLKAAVAHFWFVTIHPFEDGNGRIARAIADLQLARADESPQRFYSMSAQIRKERNDYYAILEATQKGGLDITPWLEWFLGCLDRALLATNDLLANVLMKARFWERYAGISLNERQRLMLDRMLNGIEGKMTSSKWAKMAKCSQDTAGRDIQDLVGKGVLMKEQAGGRSTSYILVECDK